MFNLPDPWPDDDEEAGEMAADLARGIVGNLTGGLPIVKDFVNFALEGSRNFRLSPVETAADSLRPKTLMGSVEDLTGDQKHVASDIGNIATAVSLIPGSPAVLPVGQLKVTAEGIINFDEADGLFEALYRLFVRKPPK